MGKRGVRGQVTIFLIFAVILLIAAGILFYVKSRSMEITPQIKDFPTETLPIQRFIESCILDIGNEAVIKLGARSGYIDIPEEIANNPSRNLKFSEGFTLPYWYYDFRAQIPSKQTISGQIADYVSARMDSCLDDYRAFKGFIVDVKAGPKATAVINDDNVLITLNYPIEVILDKTKTKGSSFSASIPIRLGKILRLANEVMAKENLHSYIEQKTIDIMAANKDIPFTDIAFSCIPLSWKEEEIENITKKMLYANLPLIRIKNTKYRPFLEEESRYESPGNNPPKDMVEYAMFFWDALDLEYPEMRVGISYYPDWPMKFKANPSSKGIMKTEKLSGGSSGSINLAGLCLQFSHFAYDIEYPVRVSIFDESSGNNGYLFSFAFPVTIFRNTGIRNTAITADEESQDDFCEDLADTDYMIWVRDSSTFLDVPGTDITFSCIRYECSLGKTDESGKLSTKLPLGCLNGFIKAEKQGYLQAAVQTTETQTSIPLELKPLHEVSLAVTKYNNDSRFISALAQDEKGIIYLKQKEGNYEVYAAYETGNEKISLIAGKYDAEVYIYKGDALIGGYNGIIDIPNAIYSASSIEFQGFDWTAKQQEEIIRLINKKHNSTEVSFIIR